jgi:hypothetical protein
MEITMANSIPVNTVGGETTIVVAGNFNGGLALLENLAVNGHPDNDRQWSPVKGDSTFSEPATRTFSLWGPGGAKAYRLRLINGTATPELTVTIPAPVESDVDKLKDFVAGLPG